jgi:hypothetical protein
MVSGVAKRVYTFSSLPIYTVLILHFHPMKGSLQRNTPICTILKEHTTIDLSLVKVLALIAVVNHIGRSSGLLEYAELELAATSEVSGLVSSYGLEFCGANRVIDADLAVLY